MKREAYHKCFPLIATIILGEKSLPGMNTLAYFALSPLKKNLNKLEFVLLVSLFHPSLVFQSKARRGKHIGKVGP
jgi:hypothetical protein